MAARFESRMGAGHSRREVFRGAGGLAAAVAVAGGLAACGSNQKDDTPQTVDKNKVPVGSGLVAGAYVVVQPSAGEFHAYTAICPHQGCLVRDITQDTIVCPCHSSTFKTSDGSKVSGPAPTGLQKAQLKDNGDTLTVGPLEG